MQTNGKVTDFLENTQKELSSFFDVEIKIPEVCLTNSRKEIDDILGWKTQDWLTGFAKDGKIYILNPNVYIKESDHENIEHFWKTLKHEYCHIYFRTITRIGYPKWLNEGLACYLSGQDKKEPTKQDALKIFDYFQKNDWQTGEIGYFWVRLLISKFGKKKLLELIKCLKPDISEKEFAENFYKIYGIRYSKEETLKRLEKAIKSCS